MKHLLAIILRGTLKLIFRLFPLNKNKIIFNNFNGRGYGCNPKYIAEELRNRGLDLDIVWIAPDTDTSLPESFRRVTYGGVKQLYEVATAKVIVTNVKNDLFFIKRKSQLMIETWHGSYTSKKIEKQAPEKLSPEYLRESRKTSAQSDIFLSNSRALSRCFRDAFWCTCEILECGFPRNDIFFSPAEPIRQRVRESLGVPGDAKLVLYAPTFRDDGATDCYSLDIEGVLQTLCNRGGDWRAIIRLHPNVAETASIFTYNESVLNGSVYPDMQELLIASDILITDYSSTVFDFAVMNKPSYIFAPDYVEYQELRGLTDDFFNMPYKVCRTNAEVLAELALYTDGVGKQAAEKFMEFYGGVDNGTASKTVADRILQFMNII